ncbi:NUDIX hydrolase [Actinotalea ferrariae CF5-4]|uniref:NUDIX hydrolase n=1 Tax=Actinotalea ferrariae CF5-4 TaxID=948458 RepID=A0A021VKT9_9CELL|nr:NUDIX hydrolase [Actinotalea ferrariae]EYR61801.1 NUDIX hydrolase [Actinotalea ferrariae CF5-4]
MTGAGGPTRPAGLHRQPGDGWVECDCGRRHWGLHGAAGLLLFRTDPTGRADAVVLQHRAEWSDQGGTWGIPGGALAPGERPEDGAVREAAEEAGIDPDGLVVQTTRVLDHGTWSYTTVVARATAPHDPRPTDAESLAVAWVRLDDVPARLLLPAFGTAWPGLRDLLP